MLWRRLDRWLAPAPDPARVTWLGQGAYAHRGLHGAGRVENSPCAFASAIAAGLGIECDVHCSADGQAIVFHDFDLDRLTAERGPLAERRADELTRIRLGETEDRIPTLRDLLVLIDARVPLLIELKAVRHRPVAPLCEAVSRDLASYRGSHAVMSFDPRVGRWFARHAPQTVRGLVVTERNAHDIAGRLRRHLALWHARPDFLACDIRDLPSRFALAQRARGLPLLTWTVSTAALAERASLHADAPIAEGEGVATAPPSA